jgi:predicted metal-binding protein
MGDQNREIISSVGTILHFERYERFIPMAEIEHAQRFRDMCGTCPHYGKNLSCPPNTPEFIDYIGQAGLARVLCFRVFLDKPETTTVTQQMADLRQVSKLLSDELGYYLKLGYRVAGNGGCRVCETCAGETGEAYCRKPSERIFSLEAMGVDVASLIKRCFDITLEWNREDKRARFLCAAGAVFYCDESQGSN